MVRAFYVDPIAKTVKPYPADTALAMRNKCEQYEATFSSETPSGALAEHSATILICDYAGYTNTFEFADKQYRSKAVILVNTDDKVTPEMLGVAF
jgi:hypothetical protein